MKVIRLVLTLCLTVSMLLSNVTAGLSVPPLPSGFYGSVRLNGSLPPVGTVISAQINGVTYATIAVRLYEGDTVYGTIAVPGDDSSTPAIIEGGVPGNIVTFLIGGVPAAQTAPWMSGTNVRLDLSAQVNGMPQITETDPVGVTMSEDGAPVAFNLTLHATDPENNTLTWSILTQAARGTAVASGTGAEKTILYTPQPNYNGADTFVVQVSDGSLTDTVTVNVTIEPVNDLPVAVGESYTTAEDTPVVVAAPGLLANDSDIDGTPLTAVQGSGPAHGTLNLSPNGSFTYTPAANWFGSDSFTYRVSDGQAQSNEVTVSLTVNSVNDAPAAANDSYNTDRNVPLTVPAPGVLANDSDAEGSTLSASKVTDPAHGTVTFNANGSFLYTPATDYAGFDSFTYTVSDGVLTSPAATVTINVAATNRAPVAVNDSYSSAEDTVLTVTAPGVLTNDTDADANVLSAVQVTGPANGSLALNANGSFSYTPTANWYGSDSFTYRANDGTVDSNTATVTLTVTPVADAPVAVSDSYSTPEDVVLTVTAPGVLSNDTDADGNTLTAVRVTGPAHGTLNLNPNGSFIYTPVANWFGTDSFTYKANDGTADSNTVTVTITVNAVNDVPVAVNDSYSTDRNTILTIAAPGVLGNDSDVETAALTAAQVTGPVHGTLTLNANGSFTYTPENNYAGTDTFTYRANDGTANSNTATVTIAVAATNRAPVAVNDSYSTAEDTALTIAAPGVLANDTDADGNSLTAVLVVAPAQGSVTLNPNGSFTYTPVANASGTVSFTYRANDGTVDSNTATVTITVTAVNDVPAAVNDSYSTAEDTALNIAAPGVLGNDSDVETAALTAVLVTGPAHGSLTLNANGSFSYVPTANWNGSDSFSYKANDGTVDSSTATVTLTVTPVADAPVAVNDSYSTVEDTALTIAAPGVLANDTDADGNTLTAIRVTGPAHGTLALSANGSFLYTPDANWFGSDSFTYKANDGTVDSNTVTVTVTVNAVNDTPAAANDSYSTGRNTVLNIAAPGVLENDSDVETAALTAALVTATAHGNLVLNPNGSFSYTPDLDYAGTDSFTYRASDGTASSNLATVTIAVAATNRAPVAVNDSYTTAEDTILTVTVPGVLANDTDVDGNSLTAVLVAAPAQGSLTLNANGSFSYTPVANASGTVSFTYRANDGTVDSNTATVTITVNSVNDTPVAVADSYTTAEDTTLTVTAPAGVLANDSDVETALTAVQVTGPAHGTLNLNANGSFTYTPSANWNGTDSFTYRANDGTANSNTVTVTITVTPVADAPVAANDSYSTPEDVVLNITAPGVLSNDTDADGNTLTAVLVAAPASGSLTLNPNGSFSYTPVANASGTVSFTYKANDGTTDSNTVTVTITVNAVNDVPVAVNDSYSTDRNTVLTVAAPGVLVNDSDVETAALTAVLVTDTAHGDLTLNANGSFSYTPDLNYAGTDSFTYRASDGTASSNTATVTIAVADTNRAPVAVNDSFTTPEDTILTITAPGVLGNDTDADNNALTALVVTSPAHGTLNLNPNGSFTYTPAANWFGSDSFTYKANDGTVDSNTATVTITVNSVNDTPVAGPESYSTAEDTALTVAAPGVLANDSDVETAALTAVQVTGPAHGSLTLNANGSFTYVPAANWNGTDTFIYRANDGVANSNPVTVTITVTPVADAPVAANDSYSTTEDVVLTVAAPGVLGNDSSLDGGTLTTLLVSGPAHGTLNLNPNGSFTYTPATHWFGTDSFTYKARLGTAESNTATVTISVTGVNYLPLAANDDYSTAEDTALTINAPGVLANDSDVETTALTSVLVTEPAHGTLAFNANGSFLYTPAANWNGTDSFTYRANDGTANSNTATVTLAVTSVNDAPLAANDSFSVQAGQTLTTSVPGVLSNDTDVEGSTLIALLLSGPAHGELTLNANGSFSYTPAAGFSGADSFTYQANDGAAGSNTATVAITVQPVQSNRLFSDSFESGTLAAWSAAVTDGGDLSVTAGAAMCGSAGMQALIDDNIAIFVTDNSPANERFYQARFTFDPNSIPMVSTDRHMLFQATSATGAQVIQLEFRFYQSRYEVRVITLNDSAVRQYTDWTPITDAAHSLDVLWKAAAAGASDGSLTFLIDGVQKGNLTALDNDTHSIDRVQLGAVRDLDTGTRGTYFFDCFESFREPTAPVLPLVADFTAAPSQGLAPLTVTFTNKSAPAGRISSYLWDFGDGSTSTLANPTYVYANTGTYTVTLTAFGTGEQDSETKNAFIHVTNQLVNQTIFDNSFENGTLAGWSQNKADLGDIAVTTAAALSGNYGMHVTIDDRLVLWVLDNRPLAETNYHARFLLDPNGLTMANRDTFTIFMAYTGDATTNMISELQFLNGAYQVRAGAISDAGTWTYSPWVVISDAPHSLELGWKAAAPGANNGSLVFLVDGVEHFSVNTLDNDTHRVDRARIGAIANIDAGTLGAFYMDAFESWREVAAIP